MTVVQTLAGVVLGLHLLSFLARLHSVSPMCQDEKSVMDASYSLRGCANLIGTALAISALCVGGFQ